MKKTLSLILCFCIAISICTFMPTIAYAEDSYISGGTGSSTITYTQPSEYSILIPETIDSDAGQYVFWAGTLNIADNEQVYVTIANTIGSGRIEFTHENGVNKLTKEIIVEPSDSSYNIDFSTLPEHCVGYFYGDNTMSKIRFGLSEQSYDCEYAKAGNYTATVNFEVSLIKTL